MIDCDESQPPTDKFTDSTHLHVEAAPKLYTFLSYGIYCKIFL